MGKKFDRYEYYDHLDKKELEKYSENNKQSTSKITYYIDEEKKTVVAVMTDCEYDAIDILEKMGIRSISHNSWSMDKFMINTTYRGKAKCSPDDEWDEEEGMCIARNRMLANYYRARTMALMHAEKIFQDILDELGSRIDYSDIRFVKAENEFL